MYCLLLQVILKINLDFQSYSCNGCHNVMHNSLSFDDVEIIIVGKNDYGIHFWDITKGEVVSRI